LIPPLLFLSPPLFQISFIEKSKYTYPLADPDHIMYRPRKEQFTGCLIGQCLGDALGFPVEGHTPQVCRNYVDDYLRTGRAGEICRSPFPFGQYTDDSILARTLMESYVDCEKFNPVDYANRIAELFRTGRMVGYGMATKLAADRLIKGVPWKESGTPSPSAGNGSAMRAGPIGLFHHDDPDRLVRAAADQGRITHKDHRCVAGAAAIAGALSLAIREPEIDVKRFTSQLAGRVKQYDYDLVVGIFHLQKWISYSPEKAVDYISKVGVDPDYEDPWEGISPFVTTSVLWSLYSFLRNPEDYWETICTAIGVGGDVDTTAAMAGAISGAHLGLAGIPGELAMRLNDQGRWDYGELVELAERCWGVKMGTDLHG